MPLSTPTSNVSLSEKVDVADLKMIGVKTDFLGINYYSRGVIKHDPKQPMNVGQVRLEDVERTFMDWEVYPQGLSDILVRIKNDYGDTPIYVTENGASYLDTLEHDGSIHDNDRLRYFEHHFEACQRAMQQGVNMKGYFIWSLMDNFEWASGYSKKFGITYIEDETLNRIPKASALWYKEVIEKNGF